MTRLRSLRFGSSSLAALSLLGAVQVGCSSSSKHAPGASGAPHSGRYAVMMLGDSITAATCYPELVSKGFIASGHRNFQFVGSQPSRQACDATSVKEEGHSGYGVTYLPMNSARGHCTHKPGCGSHAELLTWAAEKPDIVLMHYGTNDVWDGRPTADILSAYASVIAEFRARNPSVVFFVSKIIKLSPKGCTSCPADAAALAAALTDAWATSNSLPDSPVFIVDDYDSGFDPANTSDTADGVHPTRAGAQKMADATVASVIAKNYF